MCSVDPRHHACAQQSGENCISGNVVSTLQGAMVSKFTSATSVSGVGQDDWQIDVSNKQQLEFFLGPESGPIAISNLSIRISPAPPRDGTPL